MNKETLSNLSSNGELRKSSKKKFQETVLLVPFYGAEKKNLNRHASFLNELGYDCVLFDLKDDLIEMTTNVFSSRNLFGVKHSWADQIEVLLNELPGNKIVFSFSNPSASAIEAISRRFGTDIKGLICDSGPSAELWQSFVNYFTHENPLPTWPLKMFAATATAVLWNPQFAQALQNDLKKFPIGFRILSIRGWKDPLITPKMIDHVFEPHEQIEWKKLSLPDAAHLNGLKDFADDYEPAVEAFLREISTELK